ncbi:MAG TPA: hypothetical protein EYP60_01630 [bacterium (Candidatus Stahlbacteria)]|nr:hypothetical protein [Candidatus Stahlbacteria bacterium]
MRGVKTLICMMVLWMGVAIATPPYMPPLYEVQVTIDGTPRVGETYTLRFEVRSLIKDVSTHVFVYIPPQIEILEGITTWDGYLEAGTTLSFSLTLRGLEKGTYNIYAQVWTDHEEEENLTYRIQNLYVVSTDTSGTWGTSSTFYREHFLPFLESQATRDTGEYGIQQHQITVQGQVRYFNKDVGVNSYEAFPGAIVRLLDVSGSVIAEALTDANGNYSMSASVYSGNYMIKVWARNSAVRMTNADYFEPVHWITVVSDHTYYVDIDVDISQAEWARILQNIKKGYDFTEEKFNWTRNYQIEVEYHNEQGTSYFWYWSVWPAHDEKIHVYQNDVWDNPPDYYWGRYVCTHEYGHAVMFEYFDWSMPEGDGPDPHIYAV